MSDSESILTEDFAAKFQETQEKLNSKDLPMKLLSSNHLSSNKTVPTTNYSLSHKPKPRDTDSIRTEDFQSEFRRSMVQHEDGENKWLRGTTLSGNFKSRTGLDLNQSKVNGGMGAELSGSKLRNAGPRGLTTGYTGQMYNSHEDLSTLPDSASEAGRPIALHNVTQMSRSHTFAAPSLPLRNMGNLSSISPMRRDIMSKFLEKYGSSDVGASSIVKRPIIPVSNGTPLKPNKLTNMSFIKDPLDNPQEKPTWKQQTGLRHSIAVPRPSVSPIPEMRNYSDDDISAEIRTKSEQIQREIQQERSRKFHSPSNVPETPMGNTNNRASAVKSNILTPRETLDEKMREVDRISQSLREAQEEKEKMLNEMTQIEESLRKQKAEVRLTSKLIQDRRSKVQNVHTELLHAETRRDQTQKYLDELNIEMAKKKQQLAEMERTLMQRMNEAKSLEDLGLTKEEIESVIAERNELYEIIKLSEESENQKYELEKQLTLAREDLTIEQRRYRERIETLEEELEASMEKISALQSDREELILRLETVEIKFQNTEADLESLNMENRRLAQENTQYKQTNSHMQSEQETKQTHLRQQIQEMQQENQQLRNELSHSKREQQSIKEGADELQQEIAVLKDRLEELRKSHQLRIQSMEKDHARALEQCEEQLRAEAQTMMTQSKITTETEKQEALDSLKRWHEDQLRQVLQSNRELQDQNDALQARVTKQENDIHMLLVENESDEKMKIRRAVNRERERWETEQDEKWRSEISNLKSETQGVVKAAQNEVEKEREKSRRLQEDLDAARKNLQIVEENLHNKSEKEKQLEQAKRQTEAEKKKEMSQLQQEYEKAMQARETALMQKEKTFQEFVEQRKAFDVKYLELQTNLRKMGLVVIGEVREECRRIMEAIKMELPKFKHDKENVAVDHIHEAVWDALANLRACAEEFRRSFTELQAEKDKLLSQQSDMEESHKREIAQVTEKVTEEKSRELADFKDQMLKDHLEEIERLMSSQHSGAQELLLKREQEIYDLRRSMNQWKQETTERVAAQLQREFHMEYEKRLENAQLGGRGSKSATSINGHHQHGNGVEISGLPTPFQLSTDNNPVQLINQLKKVVQKLREENLSLRKVLMAKNVNEAASPTNHSREVMDENLFIHSRSPPERISEPNRSGSSGNRSPQVGLNSPLLDQRRNREFSSSSKTPTPTPQPRRQTPIKDIRSPEIRSRSQSRSSASLPLSHHRGSSTPIPHSGSQDMLSN